MCCTTPTLDGGGMRRRGMEYIASALEGIDGEMAAGLLPALDLPYIEGWPVSSIDKFCTARRLSGHPVTVYENEKLYA
jgi:hypothetical protein